MRFPWMLCATAGLLTLGVSAFADDTINYTITPGNYATFNIYYQNASLTPQGPDDVRAGPFTATVTGFPDFTVYCVDLEHAVANPSQVSVQTVAVPPAQGGSNHYDGLVGTYTELNEAAWLFDNYSAAVAGNADEGAALQAAIWNVIDGDTDFSVSTGVFHITQDTTTGTSDFNTIVSDANSYLGALHTALNLGGTNGMDLAYLYQVDRTQSGGQDMLSGPNTFNQNTPTTPEGASLLMFLPGLIPVAVGLRRRRNKAAGK